MTEKIAETIQKFNCFSLLEGGKDKNRWKALEDKVTFLPVQYQWEFIDYQKLYFRERVSELYDLRMVITSGNHDVGIWSLFLIKENGIWKINTCGLEIFEPRFDMAFQMGTKTKRKFYKNCLSLLKEIAIIYNISCLRFSDTPIANDIEVWHRFLMENNGTICKVTHQALYDTLLSADEAKQKMHKSILQRIKDGYQYYDYEIISSKDTNIDERMRKFREFHIKVSGRETRGIDTWKIQAEGIRKNRDFAIFQYDKETREMDGASLFTVTHSCCYYSVSAYNRDKFDRPIGHMAQDVAISNLRTLGVRWYIVGDRYYPANASDEKNLHISEYKEAFSTNIFPKFYIDMDLNLNK